MTVIVVVPLYSYSIKENHHWKTVGVLQCKPPALIQVSSESASKDGRPPKNKTYITIPNDPILQLVGSSTSSGRPHEPSAASEGPAAPALRMDHFSCGGASPKKV